MSRVHFIDFLKGLGIILVVLGHSNISGVFRNWIYIFHMPLFFVISGFLCKDNDLSIGENIKKKCKSLLYPYYVIGGVYILHNVIREFCRGDFLPENLAKKMAALVYGNYIWDNNAGYIGTLWFLAALFCTEIIFIVINRSKDNKIVSNKKLIIRTLLIYGFGYILSILINFSRQYTEDNSGIRLPLCIDISVIALIFYSFGYCYKKLMNVRKVSVNVKVMVSLLLITAGSAFGFCNWKIQGGGVDMLYLRLGNPLIFAMAGISLSAGMLLGAECLYEIGIRIRILESFGQMSLLIMAIHLHISSYVDRLCRWAGITQGFIAAMILTVISWGISLLIDRYLPQIYKFHE